MEAMELQGHTVGILVEQQYEDLELWYPYYRLREAEVDVRLIGPEAGKAFPSKHGYPARTDAAAKDVGEGDLDGLLIPGGFSPDYMRRSPEMVKLATAMVQADKPVGAICHAGWMLASTGQLKGRKVTSFHSIRADMENAGADWRDEAVVQDGNLITSRFPADLPAYMKAFLGLLIERRRK